ncbi:putative transmembrane protein [Paraburkholderia tropica]|uniref:YeeE/YedE family protein n=1 Tax=Paraburkholderia tropica TaxID=92647 RepID=UPI001CB014D2|nr:YeeE/YedE family protein [Paraburkholderia tropica]CAG9224003.1 putative transmembrane protein [Paraburkholderia tropica]
MNVDLAHFTPFASLAGGLMIGAATAWLVLGNGRVAGISGIVGGLLRGRDASGERAWRLAFVAGLCAAPWLWWLARLMSNASSNATPNATPGTAAPPASAIAAVITASPLTLIVAGLLVGVGTRYASGCTSGHGVCGIARGSLRSFAATGLFMAAGFVTVYVARHLAGA